LSGFAFADFEARFSLDLVVVERAGGSALRLSSRLLGGGTFVADLFGGGGAVGGAATQVELEDARVAVHNCVRTERSQAYLRVPGSTPLGTNLNS
jgi:hypothetical protein